MSRLELTPDQYRELCHRIGRAVLAMHQTREAWFNGIYHGKGAPKDGMQDVCAIDDERVPKWLQRIIEQEGEAIVRGYPDTVGCHYPKDDSMPYRQVVRLTDDPHHTPIMQKVPHGGFPKKDEPRPFDPEQLPVSSVHVGQGAVMKEEAIPIYERLTAEDVRKMEKEGLLPKKEEKP